MPISAYPVPTGTPVAILGFRQAPTKPEDPFNDVYFSEATNVVEKKPEAKGREWKFGRVVEYKDDHDRAIEIGSSDDLHSMTFTQIPTPEVSGSPIIDFHSGAVVGLVRGFTISYGSPHTRGFGTPATSIFNVSFRSRSSFASNSRCFVVVPTAWIQRRRYQGRSRSAKEVRGRVGGTRGKEDFIIASHRLSFYPVCNSLAHRFLIHPRIDPIFTRISHELIAKVLIILDPPSFLADPSSATESITMKSFHRHLPINHPHPLHTLQSSLFSIQ